MAFDINKFRSSFAGDTPAGLSSPALFDVVIRHGAGLLPLSGNPDQSMEIKGGISTVERITYRCESCILPSRTLLASDRKTNGPIRKVATGVNYDDVTLSFILSSDMVEKFYFYQWHKTIVNNEVFANAQYVHDVRYYSDYISDIDIRQYNKIGNHVYQVTLFEAYPISIREVPLGWDLTNEYIKLNVVMAYRNFTESNLVFEHPQPTPEPEIKKFNPKPKYNFPYLKGII